jgi:hypothetical protein
LNFLTTTTPQRNGKVERKFQTLYGRIRAMLNDAGLENDVRSGVWSECANTVTFLSNITSTKCPHQLLLKVKPKLPSSLRIFGEMGVMTTNANIQGKLANRGTTCMLMGYSVDHSNDVFHMLNPKTRRIINLSDVIWLGKSLKIWSITDPQGEKDDIDDDLSDLILKPIERSQVNNEIPPEIKERTKIKLYRQLNVEDGIVKVEFLNSSENISNIFTQNVSQDTYERHAKKFLGSIEDFRNE